MSKWVNSKEIISSIHQDNFNDAKLAGQCQVDLREHDKNVITAEKKCANGGCALPPTQHLKIRVRFFELAFKIQ